MDAQHSVVRVSRNGQVPIPADVRARWQASDVLVVDLGDRIVMRPTRPETSAGLVGKYRGRGLDTDQLRRSDRAQEA